MQASNHEEALTTELIMALCFLFFFVGMVGSNYVWLQREKKNKIKVEIMYLRQPWQCNILMELFLSQRESHLQQVQRWTWRPTDRGCCLYFASVWIFKMWHSNAPLLVSFPFETCFSLNFAPPVKPNVLDSWSRIHTKNCCVWISNEIFHWGFSIFLLFFFFVKERRAAPATWQKFVSRTRLYLIFPKQSALFVDFSLEQWKAVVKSKTKFNNLRRGLVFLYGYFLSSFFHLNHPKEAWQRESRAQKPCEKDLIHNGV